MARPIIASKLIRSVRNRALIPTDTSTYQDEDILDILNEEVTQGLLATIMSLNEEHMVDHIDIPITSIDLSNGVKIPERAVGNKLRDVSYISSGKSYELTRITLEDVSDYENGSSNYTLNTFYVEGDKIKFISNDIQADSLRVYFYMMPNDIVHEENCGKIFNINDNLDDTTTLTLVSIPDNFSNHPIMDLVSNKVPNKIIGYDISPTPLGVNATLKTVTFLTVDIPCDLSEGDYICEQFTSPYLNMPTEMHALLAQRAAIFILEALNDTEGLKNALMRLNGMERSIQTILENRVEGAPQKIVSRHSTLKQTYSFGTRGRGRGRS